MIISHHALEHVPEPYNTLRSLFRKLRPGGKIIVVVPCDKVLAPYRRDDPDQHLYSWSASNLGNLLARAGYNVLDAREIVHKWPTRHHERIARAIGWRTFHTLGSVRA